MAKLSDKLKEAIKLMPVREKDKLLLRLVAKNPILVEQLYFQLIEGKEAVENRRQQLSNQIIEDVRASADYFYSPGYLLLNLRDISGSINHHVKVTKDKYGEIELNLLMLNQTFSLLATNLQSFSERKSKTFDEYVVKRTQKIIKLLDHMHEDVRFDFRDSLRNLLMNINQQLTTSKVAIDLGLDVQGVMEVI